MDEAAHPPHPPDFAPEPVPPRRRRKPVEQFPPGLLLWGGLFFFLLGLPVLHIALHDFTAGWGSDRWPMAKGVVVRSRVEMRMTDRRRTYYDPLVTYRYEVGGKSFTSDRLSFSPHAGTDEDEETAAAYAARYPAGSSVAVHYQPDDAATSVLEAGVNYEFYLTLAAAAFCVGGGGVAALFGWRGVRTRRRKSAGDEAIVAIRAVWPLAFEVRADARREAPPFAAAVTAHSGRPIDPAWDFFQAPPPQIGTVLTAHSTLRRGQQARTLAQRRVRWLLTLALLGAIFCVGYLLRPTYEGLSPGLMIAAVLGAVISPLVMVNYFRHFVTYVGSEGVARYTLAQLRGGFLFDEVMPFADAIEVRAKHTRHYQNGFYKDSTSHFYWTGPDGKELFHAGGVYVDAKGGIAKAKEEDYLFGLRSELTWSEYLLDRSTGEWERQGYLQFNVKPGEWVRVWAGGLDLNFAAGAARLEAADVKSLTLEKGKFHIVHRDAGWFARQGKFAFEYGEMANGRLFLMAVERLAGLRFN